MRWRGGRRHGPRRARLAPVERYAGRGWSSRPPRRRRRRRWVVRLAVIAVLVLLLPIPWLHVRSNIVPATAWRLDGRLEVEGRTLDPPGRWTWLAVGRPQVVGEWLWDRVSGSAAPPQNLRHGLRSRSPALSEPSAAAIGLRAAGREIPLGLLLEVREPTRDGYPETARIVMVDGIELTDRHAWEQVTSAWSEPPGVVQVEGRDPAPGGVSFSLRDGRRFVAPGPGLPYRVVNVLDTAPADLDAGITFGFTRWLPVDWFRNLSLGSSHGLMVSLVAYTDASGRDLAQGRHIAGTGGIRGDGIVSRIGGLPEKARAAQRAGADVLLFPASQEEELEGEELEGLTLVPVRTLGEAIEWLERPLTRS